jgi:hypothetical protein
VAGWSNDSFLLLPAGRLFTCWLYHSRWPSKWSLPVTLASDCIWEVTRSSLVWNTVLFQVSGGCSLQANLGMRSPLFCVISQRLLVDVYRRFGTAGQFLKGQAVFSYYRHTLKENAEERRPHLHRGGSLQSRKGGLMGLVTARPVFFTAFHIHYPVH